MRTFLRDNGLTLVLGLMFLVSVAGMVLTEPGRFQQGALRPWTAGRWIGLPAVSTGEEFPVRALRELGERISRRWAAYVVLTAITFPARARQRSRDPDDPGRPNDELSWRARYPLAAWIGAHSLGLRLGVAVPRLLSVALVVPA